MLPCLAFRRTAVWATAAMLLVAACKKEPQQEPAAPADGEAAGAATVAVPAAEPSGQWYRAVFDVEGDDIEPIPLFMQVPETGVSKGMVIRHGKQEAVPEVEWEGDTLHARFPVFQTRLEARPDGEDLVGSFVSESGTWGSGEIGFRASPVDAPHETHRFEGEATEPGNALGTWRLKFPESGAAKLSLRAIDERGVEGVLTFPSGNHIYVAGARYGDTIKLSSFDGTSLYLLTAGVQGDALEGALVAGYDLSWSEGFEGAREAADFELERSMEVAGGGETLNVPGVDMAEYKGKPLLIEMAGSWCSTCKYMAPFLGEIHEEYGPKGLQMLTLSCEFSDDEDYVIEQAMALKKEYDIPWKVVPVHGGAEDLAALLPPSLESVDVAGFPLVFFLDSNGIIRYLHSGFPSKAAGAEQERVKKAFREQVEALLAGSDAP